MRPRVWWENAIQDPVPPSPPTPKELDLQKRLSPQEHLLLFPKSGTNGVVAKPYYTMEMRGWERASVEEGMRPLAAVREAEQSTRMFWEEA